MKRSLHRFLAIITVLTLLLSCLTGCNSSKTSTQTPSSNHSNVTYTNRQNEEDPISSDEPEDSEENLEQEVTDETRSETTGQATETVKKPSASSSEKKETETKNSEQADSADQPKEDQTSEKEPEGENNSQESENNSQQSGTEQQPTEPNESTTPDPDPTPDPEPEETVVDYSKYIKIASYNVQNFQGGKQMDVIAEEIQEIDPDIIGLQEVDKCTTRSGGVDQLKELAEKLGYPYYYFGKAISYGGGEYGHGILSKYPITEATTTSFKTQYAEKRSYERVVINIKGYKLCVYNTHLCLGSNNEQAQQLAEITAMMAQDKYALVMGDMNSKPNQLSFAINTQKMIALNGGDTYKTVKNTHPQGTKSKTPIDNIIVTRSLKYYWEADTLSGIIVNQTNNSDHNMIYSYINF